MPASVTATAVHIAVPLFSTAWKLRQHSVVYRA